MPHFWFPCLPETGKDLETVAEQREEYEFGCPVWWLSEYPVVRINLWLFDPSNLLGFWPQDSKLSDGSNEGTGWHGEDWPTFSGGPFICAFESWFLQNHHPWPPSAVRLISTGGTTLKWAWEWRYTSSLARLAGFTSQVCHGAFLRHTRPSRPRSLAPPPLTEEYTLGKPRCEI